jgi:DNA invertase Pin-like site-specific DNA recombinase
MLGNWRQRMKILANLRVSSEDQVESGAGLSAQANDCSSYAARNGLILTEVFRDEGISGACGLEKRPALLAAMGSKCKMVMQKGVGP